MTESDISDCFPSQTPLNQSYYYGKTVTPISTKTIKQCLVDAANGNPEHIVYRIPEYKDSITLKSLLEQSERFSRSLIHHGVGNGDVVMVLGVSTCDYFVMFHGTVGIGAQFFSPYLYAPLERNTTELVSLVRPSIIIIGYEVASLTGCISDTSSSDIKFKTIHYKPEKITETQLNRDDLYTYEQFLNSGEVLKTGDQLASAAGCIAYTDTAYLQCTSGTTGRFKVGLLNHRTLINTAIFGENRKNPNRKRVVFAFCCRQLDDLTLLLDSLTPICNWRHGVVGVVMPSTSVTDPLSLLKFIQDEKIETLQGFPYIVTPLIGHPALCDYDVSSWKSGILVAQIISKKFREWFAENKPDYTIVYGGTEYLGGTQTSPIYSTKKQFMETVGYPFPHVELKLIGDDSSIVPINTVGEICLKGWSVANGYLMDNGHVVTVCDEDGWVHMGDLGKMDETGHLTYIGRKSDCIRYKNKGDAVYPGEIENTVKTHPKIKEAMVVGVPHDIKGDDICLCVILKEGDSLDEESLETFCKNKLYSRDVPDYYFIMESFPVVGIRNKVSRAELKNIVVKEIETMKNKKS
ncbi:hypothetical protein SNE40_003607 [Patella caerulea]|uniref:Uncharacterized protein n=1 Tax=Patella caerulea TaxID=87958 RepID=A0AAN8Q8T0_PATCE